MTSILTRSRNQFRRTPGRHSLVPMWFWNDHLHSDELTRQLRLFRAAGIREVMPFPLLGLTTPYLSDAFFAQARHVVAQARRLNMRVWFYDEYNWPGGGGGAAQLFVHEPWTRMSACRFYCYPVERGDRQVRLELPPGRVIWASAHQAGTSRRVDLRAHLGDLTLTWRAPRGRWEIQLAVIHVIDRILDAATGARWSNHVGGYLDLMNPQAVARYLEYVYVPYQRHLGAHFGKTVAGFYNDESGVWYDLLADPQGNFINRYASTHYPASLKYADHPESYGFHSTIPWTRDLLEHFRDRHGYDLSEHLHELMPGPTTRRAVAHDFFQLISQRYAQHYLGQLNQWCAQRGVQFTGHTGEGHCGGDYADQIGRMSVPGMDLLGAREALFGPERLLARQVGSIARASGAASSSCEVFGVTPWHFSLGAKLQLLSVLALNGVNLFVPIDAAYSFRSIRKHAANPPGFFQSPLWGHQRLLSDQAARLSLATALGQATVRVAALYPTGQSLSDPLGRETDLHRMESRLKALLTSCEQAQIELDLLHESSLAHARLRGGSVQFPGARYRTLILAGLDVLYPDTIAALARFVRQGGVLVVWSHWPTSSPRGDELAPLWRQHLGVEIAAAPLQQGQHPLGRGLILLEPDAGRALTSSTTPCYGNLLELFDAARPLVVLGNRYPQWIALDLETPHALATLTWWPETTKRQIAFDYQVQVSNDGRRWRTAVDVRQRVAEAHEVALAGIKARHVRVMMTQGGGRFWGLNGWELQVHDRTGAARRWTPARYSPTWPARLLPQEVASPCWREQEQPSRTVIQTARQLEDDARLVMLLNACDQEKVLTAHLASNTTAEHWDLVAGTAQRADEQGQVSASFGPWQTRVFLLRQGRALQTRRARLQQQRTLVRELAGPWKFAAEDNALPLAATTLHMADPAQPERWLPAEKGAIPQPLRFVPSLLFRAQFTVQQTPAHARLIFDEEIVSALVINNQAVTTTARREPALDSFLLSVPLARMLRPGVNTITGRYAPEIYERSCRGSWYAYPNVQPTLDAYLSGRFRVGTAGLRRPAGRIALGNYRTQGYPYLPGGGVYELTLGALEPEAKWLEVDAGGDLVEVRLNGRLLGVRISDPMLFALPARRAARNVVSVRVVTQLGPLYSPLRQPSFSTAGAERPCGVRCVRLMAADPS